MLVYNRVAELLAIKARKEHRTFGRRDLADALGMSPATVQSWIHNRVSRFDAYQIAAWCEYLNVEIGELLILAENEDGENSEGIQKPAQILAAAIA